MLRHRKKVLKVWTTQFLSPDEVKLRVKDLTVTLKTSAVRAIALLCQMLSLVFITVFSYILMSVLFLCFGTLNKYFIFLFYTLKTFLMCEDGMWNEY